MAKKKKNIIDVPKARRFIWAAYGLKSKEINEHELLIVHEELMVKFHWYHTTGKLIAALCEMKDAKKSIDYVQLGNLYEDEDVAMKIQRYAMNLLQHANCPYYREKRPLHSPLAVRELVYA